MQPAFQTDEGVLIESVDRSAFIKSTYLHLGAAILAFAALSAMLMSTGISDRLLGMLAAGGKYAWLAMLGGFMLVAWLATSLADSAKSYQMQVLGLGLYVVFQTLIFAPMLAMASRIDGVISSAAFLTVMLVAGLTWTAMTSKKDFSFLGGMLRIGGFVALGVIVAAVLFGFQLGVWFSGLMVLFAGACVLYDTSNIMRHYPDDRPAGAALHLFASIALLFWYLLRILMQLTSSDD